MRSNRQVSPSFSSSISPPVLLSFSLHSDFSFPTFLSSFYLPLFTRYFTLSLFYSHFLSFPSFPFSLSTFFVFLHFHPLSIFFRFHIFLPFYAVSISPSFLPSLISSSSTPVLFCPFTDILPSPSLPPSHPTHYHLSVPCLYVRLLGTTWGSGRHT